MAKQLTLVVAVVLVRLDAAGSLAICRSSGMLPSMCLQVTLWRSRAELNFEPARLPLVVLVAGQPESLQHELMLSNSGAEAVDIDIAAQCDDNLRW